MSIHLATDSEIKKIVDGQGHRAEHNFYHYKNTGEMYGTCAFPVFEGKYGVISFENKGVFWCYTDPLAPKDKMPGIFTEFLKWAFAQGAKKVRAEISEELWKVVVKNIKTGDEYRAIKPSYVYFWPVYDLKAWDPNLSGIPFKKLRNIKNSFSRKKINIMTKEQVSKSEILDVIKRWAKMRQGSDRTHTEHYKVAVENDFIGYDSVRIIEIDGQARAINGGWKIPNSNNFYSQLGIHDYSLDNLGDFCCIEDLTFLKKSSYKFADFGGSSPAMLTFKKKFFPAYVYKTIEFSIVKK